MSSDKKQCSLCRRSYSKPDGDYPFCSRECRRAKLKAWSEARDNDLGFTVKPVPCGRCRWGTAHQDAWLGYMCALNAAACRPRLDATLYAETVK